MSFQYGRCRNPLACSLADSGIVLRLTEAEGFFCPECARPLTPAPAWGSGRRRWALLVMAVLVLSGGAMAALLLLRPITAPPALRPKAVTLLKLSQPAPIAARAAPAPLEKGFASPAAVETPPHGTPVAAPTWPAKPKPARVQQSAKPKPVKPLVPSPAAQTPPPEQETAPPPPELPTAPQATAPVLATPQAAPAPPAAPQAPPAPGPRVIVLPPGSSLTFGPLKGVNLPSLPEHMMFVNPEQARKPGSIQVDCRIGLDGVPSDCRKIAEKGGADVSDTILAWLASGAIRYTPGMKDGHKVAERRVLTVNFGGPPAP